MTTTETNPTASPPTNINAALLKKRALAAHLRKSIALANRLQALPDGSYRFIRFYQVEIMEHWVLLLSFLAVSCELINPPEPIPAYIRIDTISFNVTQFDQGAATHQISNIWLTVDNELLGIFEMPFQVPCLKTGEKEVFIRPGNFYFHVSQAA